MGFFSFPGYALSASVPSREPTQIVGGDSVSWTRSLSSYPPTDGWTLHYRLVGGGIDATISDAGALGYYALAFATTDTDGAVATATARLIGWVSNAGGEIHTVFDGLVTVLPNLRTASPEDLTSHVDRVIAACEAAIEGRLTTDVARYGREGTFVDKLPIEQVRQTLGMYKAKRWRAENAGKLMPTHAIAFGQAKSRGNPASNIAHPGNDPSWSQP